MKPLTFTMKSKSVMNLLLLLMFPAAGVLCSCRSQKSVRCRSDSNSERSVSLQSMNAGVCIDSLVSRFELEFDSLELDLAPIAGSEDSSLHTTRQAGSSVSVPACAPVRVRVVNGKLKRHESASNRMERRHMSNESILCRDSVVTTQEERVEPGHATRHLPLWTCVLTVFLMILAACRIISCTRSRS